MLHFVMRRHHRLQTRSIPLAARVLCLILAALLLACPYTCDAGCCAKREVVGDSEPATAEAGNCSGCCHRRNSESQSESQLPLRKPSPASKINCICEGAVEKTGDDSGRCLEAMQVLTWCVVGDNNTVTMADSWNGDRESAERPDFPRSGRALRGAISSLLC